MHVTHIPLLNAFNFDPLIRDFLNRKAEVKSFSGEFPSVERLAELVAKRNFESSKRETLVRALRCQYADHNISDSVSSNVEALGDSKTFTVTTGHQLCLYTGPLYFIYKICSAIKLSRELKKALPEFSFVPVYWMASEDHDFAEVNHAFLTDTKTEWSTSQKGPVGLFDLDTDLSGMFEETLHVDAMTNAFAAKVKRAYSKSNLAEATRELVNSIFEDYGLVIIDGMPPELKQQFSDIMRDELFEQRAFPLITKTNEELKSAGYKTQIHPREINLFYIEKGIRERIEKVGDDSWAVTNTQLTFTGEKLNALLQSNPGRFSPNVVMRPLYQETILPNIAYVGGPGELAYWMQLKSYFNHLGVSFPALVLRDSALLITPKNKSKLDKLQLNEEQIFQARESVIRSVVGEVPIDFEEEKKRISESFRPLIANIKTIDPTLEASAAAEMQKAMNGLEQLEKKAFRAIKQKEETRISQVEKLWSEFFPDETPQERHDNFFRFATQTDVDLIAAFIDHFDPLKNEMKVFSV